VRGVCKVTGGGASVPSSTRRLTRSARAVGRRGCQARVSREEAQLQGRGKEKVSCARMHAATAAPSGGACSREMEGVAWPRGVVGLAATLREPFLVGPAAGWRRLGAVSVGIGLNPEKQSTQKPGHAACTTQRVFVASRTSPCRQTPALLHCQHRPARSRRVDGGDRSLTPDTRPSYHS